MNKFRYVMAVALLVVAGISVSAQETRSHSSSGGGGIIIDFDIVDTAAVPQDQQGADDFAAEDEPVECCKTTFERVKPHVN